jgi:hypothetical protein
LDGHPKLVHREVLSVLPDGRFDLAAPDPAFLEDQDAGLMVGEDRQQGRAVHRHQLRYRVLAVVTALEGVGDDPRAGGTGWFPGWGVFGADGIGGSALSDQRQHGYNPVINISRIDAALRGKRNATDQ